MNAPTSAPEPIDPTDPTETTAAPLSPTVHDPLFAGYGDATYQAILADRDGPTAREMFARSADPDPAVRRRVMTLLTTVSHAVQRWPAAADIAANLLIDPDERVRRAAAWLLAQADLDRALHMAHEPPADPVAGLALVEAALGRWAPGTEAARLDLAGHLREHPDPAVRLRAGFAALALCAPERRGNWERVIRGALGSAERLSGPGSPVTWSAAELLASAFERGGRAEIDWYLWADLLMRSPDPATARVGIGFGREAIGKWRAGPVRLLPALGHALDHEDPDVRAAALHTIGGSTQATRGAADRLARLTADPIAGWPAVVALAREGDRRALPAVRAALFTAATDATHPGLTRAAAGFADDPSALLPAAGLDRLARHDAASCVRSLRERGCLLPAAVAALNPDAPADAAVVPALIATLSDVASVEAHTWPRARIAQVLGEFGPAAGEAVPLLARLVAEAPETLAQHAALALIRITGDRRLAEARLDALESVIRRPRQAVVLLEWLVDNGGLSPRHSAALWSMAADPDRTYARVLEPLWRHAGAAALPVLLASLPRLLDADVYASSVYRLLDEMGAAAAPLLPALDTIVDSPERPPLLDDDRDRIRLDEALVERARAARARIAAAIASGVQVLGNGN
ncbi:hypothetical protein ACIBSV_28980 [Embleya sp. NPDC050154]|uniref:hypothetical protein n=1 Tax=Embleya sp. NPDC050154 TaxID=3363988 RepID=UPI0037BDBEED